MSGFACVILALLTFAGPVVTLLFIFDRRKRAVKPVIAGILTYIIAEAGIRLPLLAILGYNTADNTAWIIFCTATGAFIVEIIRYFVIKFIIIKKSGMPSGAMLYFAGFACAYVFLVWGIDALSTAALVLIKDFALIEQGELWTEIVTVPIVLLLHFGYTVLLMLAIINKQKLYIAACVLFRIITEKEAIFRLCEIYGLGSGVAVFYLAVAACAGFLLLYKKFTMLKGIEGYEEN